MGPELSVLGLETGHIPRIRVGLLTVASVVGFPLRQLFLIYIKARSRSLLSTGVVASRVVFVRDAVTLSTTSRTIIPLQGLVSNNWLSTTRLFEIPCVRPTPWSESPSSSLESPQLLGYSTCRNSSRESTPPRAYIINHTPFLSASHSHLWSSF